MLERLINFKKQLQNKQFKQGLQEGHVIAYPLYAHCIDCKVYGAHQRQTNSKQLTVFQMTDSFGVCERFELLCFGTENILISLCE